MQQSQFSCECTTSLSSSGAMAIRLQNHEIVNASHERSLWQAVTAAADERHRCGNGRSRRVVDRRFPSAEAVTVACHGFDGSGEGAKLLP